MSKETKSKFLSLRCQIQSFSNDEILRMIPANVLAEIKTIDPHPYFQAYSIAHEGESNPKILDDQEQKPILWTRRAIQSIKNTILNGIKLFCGHNKDNSTSGRREVGKVVHNEQREINGELHHIVIAYHPQDVKEEVKEYDICSQEAEWDLIDNVKKWVADKVNKITAIALQSSDREQPGFAGARRLGMIQAFENNTGSGDQAPGEGRQGDKRVTFAEVKQWVTDHAIPVWKLYDKEQVFEDKAVQKIIAENENLKAAGAEKDQKIETLETENKTVLSNYQKSTAGKRLKEIVDSGKIELTDEIKNYINKRFPKDVNNMEDVSDEGLQSYIKSATVDYKLNAEFFNAGKDDQPGEGTDGKDVGKDTPPADKNDQTKAENNPLLKEDYQPE